MILGRPVMVAVLVAFASFLATALPARGSGYPNPDPGNSTSLVLAPGAYVIDAGVVTGAATKQTNGQALKPYGLIYSLVKAHIPVVWVINPSKTAPGIDVNAGGIDQTLGNVGTDFVYDCDSAGAQYSARAITTGAYVIPKEFVSQAKGVVDTFRANNGGYPQPGTISGVTQADGQILGYDPTPLVGQLQGCTQALPTTVDVFNTITGWPRTVLNDQNTSISSGFFDLAGIPQGSLNDPSNPPAYRVAAPAELTPCDDFYVMPHADPTYATHANLRPFVEQGGYLWAGCHAVSVLEGIRVNDSPTQPLYLNFLTTDGLMDYGDHADGSAPYSFYKLATDNKEYYTPTYGVYDLDPVVSGDPVAQFRGRTDLAHQNGSEQIFMPGYGTNPSTGAARTTWPANLADASHWLPQTQILEYDPTQANVYPLTNTVLPVDSLGPAASVVYGPAFGDPNNGLVMYEGGHDIGKGSVDDAAAIRAFFNMQLLSGVNRSPQVAVTQPVAGASVASGSTIPVAGSATGGSGTYAYTWTARCVDSNDVVVAGGGFADASSATTTFTAPNSADQLDCNLSLSVVDTCGRFAFGGQSVVVEPSTPSISVAKSASPNTVSAAGEVVTYSFLVTNTGNVALTAVDVSDPLSGLSAVSCPQNTLASTASMTCTATYTVTQADVDVGSIANTATTSGSPPSGPPVTGTSSTTVTATPAASISIAKSASPNTVSAVGEVVTYSFLVTNIGNVTLTAVAVSDPLPGLSAVSCPLNSLAPSASTTCTATYTVTQADVDAGSIANTATASGTPPSGPAVTDVDSATVTATPAASISIAKSASPNTVSAVGEVVTYSFLVTNTGNVTLTAVAVSDPLPGLSAVSCPQITLAPSASTTCTATYTVTQADVDAGSIVNTATASGTPPSGPAVTDVDSATVTATPAASISVVKSASPNTVSAVGEVVTYSFLVTNTGNVTLTAIAVSDPLPGLSAVTCPLSTLAPSASTTCTATYTVAQADVDAGSIVNTATASGTPPSGPPVTDADSTTVAVPSGPGITIVKSTTATQYTAVGQILNFTLTATNTGNVTLTNVTISDATAVLGTCTPGTPATLAPGQSLGCTASHTVTQADLDHGSFDNIAAVSGTPPQGAPVNDDSNVVTVPAAQSPAVTITKATTATVFTFVGQQIPFTITALNSGNVTLTNVSITDPNAVIGTCTPTAPVTLAPGQSMSCGAVHTVTQADMTALSVSNTAYVAAGAGVLNVSGTSNVVIVPGATSPGIPRTGGDVFESMRFVGALLGSGLLLLAMSRRRRQFYLVLPPL